jgi:hypothetical protein
MTGEHAVGALVVFLVLLICVSAAVDVAQTPWVPK